jgi:hypothetical protein
MQAISDLPMPGDIDADHTPAHAETGQDQRGDS